MFRKERQRFFVVTVCLSVYSLKSEVKMKKIGLITAIEKELELFAGFAKLSAVTTPHNKQFYTGIYGGNEIIAAVSGIGKVNAALCAAAMADFFKADLIINIGVAGGLSQELNIGDFVAGRDLVYHDVWCGEPNRPGQVQGLPAQFHGDERLCGLLPELKQGLICSGDYFADNKQSCEKIASAFPQALAVDMESTAIAQTCFLYDIPFLCVRQISDVCGAEYQPQQYEEFWKKAPSRSADVLRKILEKV